MKFNTMLKIAFHTTGGETWQGGIAHLKVFLWALKHVYKSGIALCQLMSGTRNDLPIDLSGINDEIIKLPAFQRWTTLWAIDRAMKKISSYDTTGEPFLRRRGINVIFGLMLTRRYNKIPTLSWIPDFQHIHLPEMFNIAERRERDRSFLQTARISSRIILMSHAVRKDFEAFAPQYAHKARVLQTASHIPESIYEADPKSVVELYHLPEKFVYLPNQFWKHKNHELAFRAVKILKERGIKVFVVCSGYPGDYRHLSYFTDLLQKLSKEDIRDQVTFLGLVPRDHVFLLIRQAICVLNPSLFEGLGLSVDEARSVGKSVLLSDIPPHREQNPSKAVFFDPQDCEDLEQKLERIWCETLPGPDLKLEFEARQSLPERIRACAESFLRVINEVINTTSLS